jgi:DNA-directed RNA polymerase II subunit RPB2
MEFIHKYLETPGFLVSHHIDSFNQFTATIHQIIKANNPLTILKKKEKDSFLHECNIYIGGENGTDITFGNPVFNENGIQKPMYPNDARLRNMTYAFSIHVSLTFKFSIAGESHPSMTVHNVLLGYFPIMIQSNQCILSGMPPEVRFAMGECSREQGGYFIVDGSEKTIVCQENRALNSICVTKNYDDKYYYSAEIRSESDDKSKIARITAVRIATKLEPDEALLTKDGFMLHEIVVELPDTRQPIPLFIVMRALGVISDRQIIDTCLLGDNYLIDYFRDSVCDAGSVYTQKVALEFIASFTKYQTISYALRILSELFLPHIGELNFIDKAYFLGHMVKKVLRVATNLDPITDRDSFRFKRIETSGMLLTNLFKDFYKKQLLHVKLEIDRTYNKNASIFESSEGFKMLFTKYSDFFKERVTENGIKSGFKGNWGATAYSKKLGVTQSLNRLSYNSATSHLRKCVLQMDSSAKITAPRLLHSSQWGFFDPVDTPSGGDVGTHKHLAVCARITEGFPKEIILSEMERLGIVISDLENNSIYNIGVMVKLFLNGKWHGCIESPVEFVHALRQSRRNGYIPSSTSISWNITENIIYIFTDAGRLHRPLFYIDDDRKISVGELIVPIKHGKKVSWDEMTRGHPEHNIPCMIEYLDVEETNTSLITFNYEEDFTKTKHTHVEMHGSTVLGFMGNQIIFPEHNQLPRNSFSCDHSRQAVSVYNTNYQNRMDTVTFLNYGQMPLIQTSFVDSFGTLPYGVNAIVAIMCYTGYNTEDAILMNKGSLTRGMFNTSYFKTYEMAETHEDSTNPMVFSGGSDTDIHGLAEKDTIVTDKTILMRLTQNNKIKYLFPNREQDGRIDRTFMSNNVPGHRIAKVRICTERIPNLGDKFASRAGQKGTCGVVLNEEDMPFNEFGVRPDLIINPHALPSRMTIGQLVESLLGKIHVENGGIGDCTSFNTEIDFEKTKEELNKLNFHSSGTEILYNGMSGEQLESNIFIGPTYYLRLKHMVADKINFRERGPNTSLTRQPVQGRANEGGLRIGEMERDGVIANGMASFVRESMMERGDGTMVVNNTRKPYRICVDNSTGLLAVYNESKNVRVSPTLDGITFEGDTLTTIPKYERSFSVMNVPYCFKLLMHELITSNVSMRLITSDSINHFESMRYKTVDIAHGQYYVTENKLYVSITDKCSEVMFYPTNLNPSIFPWLTTKHEINLLRISSRAIEPTSMNSKYNLVKLNLPIYKTDENSMDTTLAYFVDKMKTGIFVRIKNNTIFNFTPLYNTEYTNDFPPIHNLEELIASLPEYKRKETAHDTKTWHATDCLLRTEEEDKSPTDAYLAQMYDMLAETCNHKEIQDCMFFMNRKDFPHLRKDWKETFSSIYGDKPLDTFLNKTFIPVVSQCTTENHADFPFPTGDDWDAICHYKKFASYTYNNEKGELHCKNASVRRTNLPPWNKRQVKFIWRGRATGCGNTIDTNPRMKLDSLKIDGLDAKISKYTSRIKGNFEEGHLHVEYIEPKNVPKNVFIDMKDQLVNKFMINVEGNSAAYRFGSLLGLGFCLLNVESEYTLWFEQFLKMGKITDDLSSCHCILIQHDLSDLQETIEWCKTHDKECEQISKNAMQFYETYFTKSFIYTYIADLCRGFSRILVKQKDVYKEVGKEKPISNFKIQLYKQTGSLPKDKTLIIVPYRSSFIQDRSKQLEAFIKHYKDFKILIVEQREHGKFNRGALLNCGYDYTVVHYPEITTFIMHDVDILMDDVMLKNYYGQDGHDIVHMGMCVRGDKYKGDPKKSKFLGRVIRFSKEMYKKLNGFPNTFYGWGGEDDAIAFRMENNTLFRPNETDTGEELKTENDILESRDDARTEVHKKELIILDTLQWKINGLNSIHYEINANTEMNKLCRKIIVELNPHNDMESYREYSPPFQSGYDDIEASLLSPASDSKLSPIEELTYSPATPATDSKLSPIEELTYSPATPELEDLSGDLEVLSGGDTLNPETIETKIIQL